MIEQEQNRILNFNKPVQPALYPFLVRRVSLEATEVNQPTTNYFVRTGHTDL
jgi:hypothetical protein